MTDIPARTALGPEKVEDSDTSLHLDTTVEDGHAVTVVRDAAGHIVYPAYVPPETRSPTGRVLGPEAQEPPQVGEGPRKAASDPVKLETQDKRPRPRPSVDKKFVTELTRRNRSHSAYTPALRRAGTNASHLQQALWDRSGYEDTTSSSSSSEGEEEGDEAQQGSGDAQPGQKPHPQTRASDQFRRFKVGNENYKTKGKVSKKDGRLAISVKDTSNTGYLAKALGSAVRKVVPIKEDSAGEDAEGVARPSAPREAAEDLACPKLNIVIMVIGSRGDAQPFLKIGKVLKEQYGHRVRIATHPAFREFVEKDSGLEFFSVGGDPSELMAFMVKNPGMIPTLETVKAGDIGRRRAAMAEMFEGFWRACINATDDKKDTQNLKMVGAKDPFVADAIIANPPSFVHVHCAEALGIPLHLMFTFPYTPTQAFPHPLASIKRTNVDPGYTNFISYPLVEMMVWQGLGDLVNDFRQKTLGLDPVSTLWAPGATYRLHVPFTYLWSPGLVPKPEDWGAEIDVSGFVFLDLASSFKPPSDLEKFLSSGETPIYIGFGSIVVDDADHFTEMIFQAVKLAGARALVSKGWGGLGGDNVPDNVFMLENTPHDWLFPKVSACVIHGGAGTTAIALKCGKPTMVVPFFGDQHFWGSMLERCGAGPEPVPYKSLTAEKLAEGIKYCLTEEAQKAAQEIQRDIDLEGDGAENACHSFHKHLILSGRHSMRCSILKDKVAVWQMKKTNLKLSAMAADAIVEKNIVPWRKLRLIRHNEWNDFEGPGEPVTGFAGSLMSTVTNVVGGVGGVPFRLAKSSAARRERKEKKKQRRAERAQRKQEKAAAAAAKRSARAAQKKEAQEKNPEQRVPRQNTPEVKDFAQRDKRPPTRSQEGGSAPGHEDDDDASSVRTEGTDNTADTADTAEDTAAQEFATDVSKGVGKSMRGLARAPVDLSLAVAQGFHNAPRLYGDDTVRRPPRVTGIQSGLKAARFEFAYGIYDGLTGLVRLPARGARDGGGVRGFAKGLGMGLTGFVLKDIAAVAGPIGYTLKGLAKQAERGRLPTKQIRRARILQGQRELRALDEEERKRRTAEALRGWDVMRALWEAVDRDGATPADAERASRGLRDRLALGRSRRDRKSLAAAFESVDVAERALAAVRRGDSVESVVGPRPRGEAASAATRGRPSEDSSRPRASGELRRDRDKGRDTEGGEGAGKRRAKTAEPIEEDGEGEGEQENESRERAAASKDTPAPASKEGKGGQGNEVPEAVERKNKLVMNGTV